MNLLKRRRPLNRLLLCPPFSTHNLKSWNCYFNMTLIKKQNGAILLGDSAQKKGCLFPRFKPYLYRMANVTLII